MNIRVWKYYLDDDADGEFIPNNAEPPAETISEINCILRKRVDCAFSRELNEKELFALAAKIFPKKSEFNPETKLKTVFENFQEWTAFVAQLNAELLIKIEMLETFGLETFREFFELVNAKIGKKTFR